MKPRRHVLITGCLLALAAVFGATPAYARWGPSSACGIEDEPVNRHCYALAERSANDLGSIDFADIESAHVYDWENYGFVSQEQWITFEPHQSGWIEMGQLEGYHQDCCTVHPFFAEETPAKVFHIRIAEGSGPNVYAHYLVYDTEKNNIWRMYWGEWSEEEHYGGWAEERFSEQEAGSEAGTEERPLDTGRDEVARWLNGSSPWLEWNGAKNEVYVTGAFCQHANKQLANVGNTEWYVGSC